MKLSFVFLAAAMTVAACQTMFEKSAPASATAPVNLTREQVKVREAQTGLKQLGYYTIRVDGIAGPRTASAVRRSRADFGLDSGGAIDSEFLEVINRYLVLNPPRQGIPSAADTFAVQRGLKRLGYYSGRVNGFYDRATLSAVVDYRRKNSLPVTERIDAKLLRRIERDTRAVANS